MQHLETELGFKLFVRQGKQIQLSTAGQALYEQVMPCSSRRARSFSAG
jgi:DNA-binding transcriptional LysR family regulator